MRTFASILAFALLGYFVALADAFWMADVEHQGYAPFAGEGYEVFRNVKDYGAKGDGITDDTEAINNAIADGNRCGEGCASTTTTPAVVYFPAGTYAISSSILPYYFTQLIGDASNPPILKATSGFTGLGLIDGDHYYTENLNWLATNVFYRQIRNFVIDTTNIPASSSATGIHWPTAQATSLQNVRFNMPTTTGVAHVGLLIESKSQASSLNCCPAYCRLKELTNAGGSGGFMTDLTFVGGKMGASFGNQQFTTRSLTFENCVTGINHLWDWGWTYYDLSFTNCDIGINITAGGSSDQKVGSITVFDSQFVNVPTAILTSYTSSSEPSTAGSIILENISTSNVPVIVQTPDGNVLTGSSGTASVAAWGQGHKYLPSGPMQFQGPFTGNVRPSGLLGTGGAYYTRSKPQYESVNACHFFSVRAAGAKGDGKTDDTAALQEVIDLATRKGNIVYIDYGLYLVTSTLTIPPGARIVGESYPVLMAGGNSTFVNDAKPQPLLKVGEYSGQPGTVELSDFVLGTRGAQAGAILIEWNLAAPEGTPAGLWDVHTRVGGFAGSDLQVTQCQKSPQSRLVNENCIAAFMSMHVTASASNLYAENVWLWTADHDIDDQANTQITVYAGRGLYIESTAGNIWLVGTAVEHHTLYQYQLSGTQNVFMGQIQTETPYYQPNPSAAVPFTANATYNDPDFSVSCSGVSGNCQMAWGLRVLSSDSILVYGAGLYSFFDNYEQTCIANGQSCQSQIASLEGSFSTVHIYNLNTIGTQSMINMNGVALASYADNVNVYPDTIALFQSN